VRGRQHRGAARLRLRLLTHSFARPRPAFAYLYNSSVEGWVLNNYADTGRANLADPARGSTPAPTLAVDTAVGNPDAGSLKVTAHFTDWKQYVDAVTNVSPQKMNSTFDPSMVVQIGVKFDTGGDGIASAFGSPVDAVFQIDTVSDGLVGGALPPAVNYTFDTNTQAFTLNNYDNASRKNLGGPNSPTTPVLAWDAAAGSPTPGSLGLTVTFSDFKQYIDPAVNLSSVDLTGKVLHAWVKLDSGFFTGGVQLHAGAGPSYVFASGAYTTFAALDTWIELTLDLTKAQTMVSGFVANDIRQIGVQFDTGDPYEGGAFTTPVDSVFHIDSITAP
jgi:hypothetical protein